MIFRVTLINPTLGSLILLKQPKGLSDIAPTIKRGENHGLTTEIDVKLEFFCDGAGKEFIDQVREEQGIDAEILITIEAFCGCIPSVDAPDYSEDYSDDYGSIIGGSCDEDFEDFYLGQLELKTWTTDDVFTKVNIKPRGILETVKNRLDTKVDLFATETLDGTAISSLDFGGYDINMHSKEIIFKSNVIMDNGEYTEVKPGFLTGGGTDNLFAEFPLELSDYDELGVNVMTSDFLSYDGDGTPEAIYTNDSDESVDIDISYNFVGSISENSGQPRAYQILIRYKVDNIFYGTGSTTLQSYSVYIDGSGGVQNTQPVNISGSFGITVTPGKSFYIFVEFNSYTTPGPVSASPTVAMDFSTCEVNLEQASTTNDTTAKAFAVFEAGAQIARMITDQNDSFRSNIFGRTNSEPFQYNANGCGCFTAITNGFMVRGYPIDPNNAFARTIRMSMNDYFRGLNPIWNLGMGIEKDGDNYYLVVDTKDYFYDVGTTILTLNNVPNLKRSEAPEYYYNRINAGYELWETQFTNGLDEFNSKRQFDTGIKSIDNSLEIFSSLVAAGYRIERARRNRFMDNFSEDSEDDEDNIIICLNRGLDGGGNPELVDSEKNENFFGVTNINSPETAYNLRISPMRNIIRHSNIINAGLTKYPGREIKFTSGEGNFKMTSEFDADSCPGNWNNNEIGENENFAWDDADNTDSTPIWLPEILEFQYPLTLTQFKAIEANPKGVIEVSDSEEDHIKAFILELKYKPGDLTEFKLLRAYV